MTESIPPGLMPEAAAPGEDDNNSPRDTPSLAAAIESEGNRLVSMHYQRLKEEFYESINAQSCQIEALICKIFQVSECRVTPSEIWGSGSFNVAVLVRLPRKNVYLRLPYLHRVGEKHFAGNAEEKLRTEIGTYLWLREHCPDVPIPELHAFGLPDGSIFTAPDLTPWWRKIPGQLQRMFASLLGWPVPIQHVDCSLRHCFPSGFLIISEAEGKSLMWSWHKHYQNKIYRGNLFRGLARIAVSINSIPHPRIGSLSLQPDNRTISLTNRPLNLYMHMVENDGVPSGIPRHRTYLEVESYLSDLLSLQDFKLRHQPNSIKDYEDGESQMAALAGLRATMHQFLDPTYRQGPFHLTLSDLHQSNIFVDENWNIKTIIDLEWAHTCPVEMQTPPFWLTSRPIDGFKEPSHLEEYEETLEEYLAVYKDEEVKRSGLSWQAGIQRQIWRTGSFWFFHAAKDSKGMYNLFNRHIQPIFNAEHSQLQIYDDVFYWYWRNDASSLIMRKLEDQKAYINNLRQAHNI
ncbi:hypothetical protein MY11210_009700 [Beauveria gryllotalpidicola]